MEQPEISQGIIIFVIILKIKKVHLRDLNSVRREEGCCDPDPDEEASGNL